MPVSSRGQQPDFVIPANAGNQEYEARNRLDPGVRRGDERTAYAGVMG